MLTITIEAEPIHELVVTFACTAVTTGTGVGRIVNAASLMSFTAPPLTRTRACALGAFGTVQLYVPLLATVAIVLQLPPLLIEYSSVTLDGTVQPVDVHVIGFT